MIRPMAINVHEARALRKESSEDAWDYEVLGLRSIGIMAHLALPDGGAVAQNAVACF
jgi:hypothetical protein